MKFVLDHCVPATLTKFLVGYDIQRAGQMGWARLANGKLLSAAETAGYDVLITVDKGFATQQTMSGRRISVILIDSPDTRAKALVLLIPKLTAAMEAPTPGSIVRIAKDD